MKEQPVDLLILDMTIDLGIGGREPYERIIEIRPGEHAIISSGYSQTEDVQAAQNLGAGEYIKEPYAFETFGIAIKNELER